MPGVLQCVESHKVGHDWVTIQQNIIQIFEAHRYTFCRLPDGYYVFESWRTTLNKWVQFSSVQLLSRVRLFATPWTAAHQASLSITNPWSLRKLMSIESVMPSNHLILCHSLLLLPSIFPNIRWPKYWSFSLPSNHLILCHSLLLLPSIFPNIKWPKYWSFSFNISPSNEHPGLISFRMDWLDLLSVQGTVKSLLQHHSSKA